MRRLRCRSCTQRKELLEREADAVGALRRVCVQHVEADFKRSCIEFARVPGEPNWLRVAGLHALLCQAGVSAERIALPRSFWTFVIPGMPGVKTIEYLDEHFPACTRWRRARGGGLR
jgi:hypothetical protein